jgi:hypothetical protein
MSSIPAPNIFADAQQISNNPLEEYSRAQQLQSQAQGIQQQKIQTQSQQLELQDQQNAHTLGPQFLQKDANGKITGFDNEGYYNALIGSGMNPAKVMGMRQQNLTYQTGIAKLGQDQLDLQNKKNEDAYQMVEPIRQLTQDPNADVNHINAAWQGIAPRLAQLGVDPKTMPAAFQNPQDAASRLQDMETELGQHKQLLSDAKIQGDTAEALGKGAEASANAAYTQLKTKGANVAPADIHSAVSSVVPANWSDPTLGPRTEARMNFAQQSIADPEKRQQELQSALGDASKEVGAVGKDITVATNPQIQQGRVDVATAEGRARANIEAQVARGSDAALANVPPHLVGPATAAASKAGDDYAQAQSVSQRLKAMMDAAKNGNVVSYQLLPEEGALQVVTSQGIRRINMAEIQNYGGGSLWQNLEGHIGKALTGKSIPVSVLNDMSQMQKIQEEGSQTKYSNTLKTINQNYGSKFQPVQMADIPSNTPKSAKASNDPLGIR